MDCIFPALPRSEDIRKEETLELLQMIFSFLDNVPLERFQEWLDALKMTYFILFFPQPCKEMELISADGIHSIIPHIFVIFVNLICFQLKLDFQHVHHQF